MAAALERALSGQVEALFAALSRLSGLPGPTPNWQVAEATGRFLADAGLGGAALVSSLADPPPTAATYPAASFFPICAAHALAAGHARGERGALERLRALAEDVRFEVREGVTRALVATGRLAPEDIAVSLSAWMESYLAAAVALSALGARPILDALRTPDALLLRFDQAFVLAGDAPRADRRTQGWRELIRALSSTPSAAWARFPGPVQSWLEQKAATTDPSLRECLSGVLDAARKAGSRLDLVAVRDAFDASAPPRRDPRTYVGPTRGRGADRRRNRKG